MSNRAVPRVSPIVGRSLLVTDDPAVVDRLNSFMQQFAISVDSCADPATAASLINTRKFEAIVVDLALGERVTDVLARVRLSPSNRNSVTFALLGAGEEPGSQLDTNFVLHKPLTENSVTATLKAALGLIIRDYRRYFRCPAAASVTICTDKDEAISGDMINISEGGMAIMTPVELIPGKMVKTIFGLPAEPDRFELAGEICWCDKKGRAGVHFQSVPEDQKQRLQAWLSRKIEEGIPEPVARWFQNHSGASL